jgi:hypothetical protein
LATRRNCSNKPFGKKSKQIILRSRDRVVHEFKLAVPKWIGIIAVNGAVIRTAVVGRHGRAAMEKLLS